MLHHQHSPFSKQRPRTKSGQTFGVKSVPLVRRIEKHDIKRCAFALEQIQGFSKIRFNDAKTLLHLETLKILANDGSKPSATGRRNKRSARRG